MKNAKDLRQPHWPPEVFLFGTIYLPAIWRSWASIIFFTI